MTIYRYLIWYTVQPNVIYCTVRYSTVYSTMRTMYCPIRTTKKRCVMLVKILPCVGTGCKQNRRVAKSDDQFWRYFVIKSHHCCHDG